MAQLRRRDGDDPLDHPRLPKAAGGAGGYADVCESAPLLQAIGPVVHDGIPGVLRSNDARVLSYARAGHNPPLLLKATSDQCLSLDQVGDLPLGIDPTALYESGSLQLGSGDQLLLYTDGISEARSPHGEQFEVRRIEGAMLTTARRARRRSCDAFARH